MGADLNVKEQPVSETDDAQSTPVWEQEERVKEQPSKGEGRRQRMIRRHNPAKERAGDRGSRE